LVRSGWRGWCFAVGGIEVALLGEIKTVERKALTSERGGGVSQPELWREWRLWLSTRLRGQAALFAPIRKSVGGDCQCADRDWTRLWIVRRRGKSASISCPRPVCWTGDTDSASAVTNRKHFPL